MSSPRILIVDADDNPVGSASMQEALEKGLTRRVARIMLNNPNNQLLLQKRANNERVYPGCWDNSVAGHVDEGETALDAALREMEEEIGISGLDLEFVGKYYFEAVDATGKVRKWNHLYKAEIDFTPDQLNPEEVSEVRWFNLKDIKAMISEKPEDFTDGVIEVIKRYY